MKEPICPESFDLDFARQLIEYLGGDPSLIEDNDCWSELGHKYSYLENQVMDYFSHATCGDPARALCCLVLRCGYNREKVENIIGRVECGDPYAMALCMVFDCGSDIEWAKGVFEKARYRSPLQVVLALTAAHRMAFYYDFTREWVVSFIKRTTLGNPAMARRYLARLEEKK